MCASPEFKLSFIFLMTVTYPVVNNTGFFAHGESGSWNVLLCSVTAVSATYRYTNGSYTVQSATPADANMTKRIAAMVGTGEFKTRVPNAVEGIGLVTGDYVSSFSR